MCNLLYRRVGCRPDRESISHKIASQKKIDSVRFIAFNGWGLTLLCAIQSLLCAPRLTAARIGVDNDVRIIIIVIVFLRVKIYPKKKIGRARLRPVAGKRVSTPRIRAQHYPRTAVAPIYAPVIATRSQRGGSRRGAGIFFRVDAPTIDLANRNGDFFNFRCWSQ